jgi:uncharacterized protein with HEPN domain
MSRIAEYLKDILVQLHDIEAFSSGGQTEFFQDRKTQNAIIRSYEVIGEIVKRLPTDVLAKNSHVSWKQIVGFRDFLIHNYDKVDLNLVWSAVEQLSILRATIESMLLEAEASDTDDEQRL